MKPLDSFGGWGWQVPEKSPGVSYSPVQLPPSTEGAGLCPAEASHVLSPEEA